MRKMHELPVDDPTIHNGTLREDGRMVHDTYLFRVKTPGGEQGAVRLLHADGHDPGRGGLPTAGRERLPGAEARDKEKGFLI